MSARTRTLASTFLVVLAALSLAGCSTGSLAPQDQSFVTNSAEAAVKALGSDHVKLIQLDEHLSFSEPTLSESSPADQTIVLQCRTAKDGSTTFGTVLEKNYENRFGTKATRDQLVKYVPNCELRY